MTADLWSALLDRLDNPFVLFFVMLAAAAMAVSKRLEAISGPIGSLARWWSRRQVARVERQKELWDAQHKSDRAREAARHKVERQQDTAEMEQLREDVDYLRRELADMRRRDRLRDEQARAHNAWDNEFASKAMALGLVITPPPPLYLDLAPLYFSEEEKETRP